MLQPISSFFTAKSSTPNHSFGATERFRVAAERTDERTTYRPKGGAGNASQDVENYLEAIELWLKWEACQESLTEMMYRQRSEGARIEALLDECERLRFQASEASKRLMATKRSLSN